MDEDLIVTPDVPTQVHERPLYAQLLIHFPFNISGFEQINKQKLTHPPPSNPLPSFLSVGFLAPMVNEEGVIL